MNSKYANQSLRLAGSPSKFLLSFLALIAVLTNCQRALALWTMHDQPYLHFPTEVKETKVSEKDKIAIRIAIQGQIEAFRSGDGERAFAYASPGVKDQFETPTQFFETVKATYESVLVPRSMVFEDLKEVMGVITQPVLFLSSDGDTVIASYIMEKQDNGDWKISGCYLAPVK